MPTEFISVTFPNDSTELHPRPGAPVDPDFLVRYSRVLDDYGFNYTLIPYSSASFDPFTLGATVLAATKRIKVIIALRPNTLYPTVAAKQLATLSQLGGGGGRVVVHLIAGGSDAEQAREGDFLPKDERYARLEDYIRILRRAWASPDPFDWDSKYYKFTGFANSVIPATIPVSVGGSSDAAYAVGGALADIFGLWGEPLKETREQIGRVYAAAEAAGRVEGKPRIWVTFRPIVAPTEQLAWDKAHETLDALNRNREAGLARAPPGKAPEPQNVGSQRLLDIAKRGDVQDRALWYPTVTATNAGGASTALVGSYQTVIDSLVDYIDLGAELISIRGYDNLNDAVDYGRYILPGVRKVLAEREGKAANDKGATNGANGNGVHA